MASADLRQELNCSICLYIYTDPVTLRCGHSYCRVCIDHVLDTQEGSRVYSCPECRAKYKRRPVLHRNVTLWNIVERFLSTHPDQEETAILDSPVPADRSSLHCEASLCDNHQSPEHVLCDPTNSFGDRKCSVHKEILEYYCTEDSVCICVSCRLDGEHKGHHVEMLDEASMKKKKKLRNVLDNLTTQRQETEERVRRLQERRREDQEKAAALTETVTALFRDIRRQLEDLERRVLGEISRHEHLISLSVSDLIQQLEIKKDELSRRMHDIEELCDTSDPVAVLRHPGDWSITEAGERHVEQVQAGGDLDVCLISGTLLRLSDIIRGIDTGLYVQGPADIILDVNTANKNLILSDDSKTATSTFTKQKRPKTAKRFHDYPQVMSSVGFSSGKHYYELDARQGDWWGVGMCYPSIVRREQYSVTGHNKKSWALWKCKFKLFLRHDGKMTQIPITTPLDRVRIYLDYEAGQLSFYSLCDPIRHLHTFSTTFTEPLHAVLCVMRGSLTISGGSGAGGNLLGD